MIEHLTPSTEQKQAYRSSTRSRPIVTEEVAVWGKIKPEVYHDTYGHLIRMSASSGVMNAFANGAATHSVPLVSRKPVTLMPRMNSFHPKVLDFQRELSDTLNRELPVDLDAARFTRTGVHASFDKLKTVAGYFMNPMSYTAIDNSAYRAELGLTPGYSPRQTAIASEVWKLVWSNAIASKVKVAKLSTGGGRRFTFDVQWKLAYAEWLFQPDNFERMLNAIEKGDWLELANRYEMMFFTYIQKRGQVDSIGKKRMVFDLEYALSGGIKGRSFAADKKVTIDDVHYPDFSAMRARVVHAGPWVINCFLQMCATPVMKSLFARFPKTFHVNTREEVLSQVNGKHVVASDVTEYDRSMSEDAIKVAHDTMRGVFDQRLVTASWRLFNCAYYSKPLSLEGRKGVWVGDPTDMGDRVFAGNRSGHAFTSLIAKVNKVIETLFVIDHIYPVLGRTERFLKGEMPMGFLNNGDDEVVWASSKIDLDAYLKLREDAKIGHYVVSPEDGHGFSGLLLRRVGDTEYDPTPRIHTTFEKTWSPERSIGGKHRQFWAVGMLARIDNIMASAQGRAAWDVHMSVYRRILEPQFGSLMELIAEGLNDIPVEIHGLTPVDKAVLEDPDKLYYMYSDGDVSDSVVSAVTSNIPVHVNGHFLERYYKGTLT